LGDKKILGRNWAYIKNHHYIASTI